MTQQTAVLHPLTSSGERETSRHAIVAFVWALLSFWLPIPFVPPLVALSYARNAQRHIQANPGKIKGQELTHAARALAKTILYLELLAVVAIGLGMLILWALTTTRYE